MSSAPSQNVTAPNSPRHSVVLLNDNHNSRNLPPVGLTPTSSPAPSVVVPNEAVRNDQDLSEITDPIVDNADVPASAVTSIVASLNGVLFGEAPRHEGQNDGAEVSESVVNSQLEKESRRVSASTQPSDLGTSNATETAPTLSPSTSAENLSIVEDQEERSQPRTRSNDNQLHQTGDGPSGRSEVSSGGHGAMSKQHVMHEHSEEIGQLQETIRHQEVVNRDLRTELVRQEEQSDSLAEELRNMKRQLNMFEAEVDDSAEKLRKMQQDLVKKDQQIAEKAKASDTLHQMRNPQDRHSFGDVQLVADRNRARHDAQVFYHKCRALQTSLNAATSERDTLRCQLQQAFQKDQHNGATIRLMNTKIAQLTAKVDESEGTISGLEQQVQHAYQLKDRVMARNTQLEGRVEALLSDFTLRQAEDPRELVDPMTLKHNEVRDLQQAFEQSQAKCLAVDDHNETLCKATKQQQQQIDRLQEENEQLSNKAARLSAAFEIWRGKIDNFMATIPEIVKLETGLSIEELPDLEEQLSEAAYHEECTGKALKDKALEVSKLESTVLKLKREQSKQVEVLTKRVAELHEKNIRLDEDNDTYHAKHERSENETKELKRQLTEAKGATESWFQQCEQQAFGPMVGVVRGQHERDLKHLKNEIEALLFRVEEFNRSRIVAESDLGQFKYWAAEKMAGIRELGAWRDWYQAQTEALRERFQDQLLVNPLEIPFKMDFWDLTDEEQHDLLGGEDRVIQAFTGVNLDRAKMPQRRLEVLDLWKELVTEYLSQQQVRSCRVSASTIVTEEENEQPTPSAGNREAQGEGESARVTETESEGGPSSSRAAKPQFSRGSSILF